LFVFNLLPIPPLDGSRVLYAFAPEPLQDFMEQIEPYGLIIVFALVLAGGLGGFVSELNQSVLNLLP
jgi:Zn-dependent protease